MKKRIILIAIFIFVLLVLFVVFKNKIFGYSSNYFNAAGVHDSFVYSDIIADKGKPIKTALKGIEYYDYYKDCTLVYRDNNPKKFKALVRVEITTNKIKFGLWRIGVGSTKKQVERAYMGIQKIIDLPENQIGFIDNDAWVQFYLDKNDNVEKILITDGP